MVQYYLYLVVGDVELVVIRGRCILHPDLVHHVNGVIKDAVRNRRGVRVGQYLDHLWP